MGLKIVICYFFFFLLSFTAKASGEISLGLDTDFTENQLVLNVVEPVSNLVSIKYPQKSNLLVNISATDTFDCKEVEKNVREIESLSPLNGFFKVYLEQIRPKSTEVSINVRHLLNLNTQDLSRLLIQASSLLGKPASFNEQKIEVMYDIKNQFGANSLVSKMPDKTTTLLQFTNHLDLSLKSTGGFKTNKLDLVCDLLNGGLFVDVDANLISHSATFNRSKLSLKQIKKFIEKSKEVVIDTSKSKNPEILSSLIVANSYDEVINMNPEFFGWKDYSILIHGLMEGAMLVTDISRSHDIYKKFLRKKFEYSATQMEYVFKVVGI